MYRLYYSPGLASVAPHLTLCELGASYELVRIDRSKGEHKTPGYLALNPNGRIPTLVDGDLVMFEAAAICLHLADRHPEGALLPPLGTAARAEAYKWLAFLTNSLQVDFWQYFRPEFYVPDEQFVAYKSTMAAHVVRHLTVLDDRLSSSRYLAGEAVSVADFYLFMLGRWTRRMEKPARDFQHLGRFMQDIAARQSVDKIAALEPLDAPLY